MREMQGLAAGRLSAGLINALYPSKCPNCSGTSDSTTHAPFCSACWSSIERYSGGACRICSNPFVSEYSGVCSVCIKKPPVFSKAVSFGIYDKVLAQAIHSLKFQKIKRLHKPLGALLLQLDMSDIDAVVPVPLSVRALRERGFNQSLLLAKVLAQGRGSMLVIDGLLKKKDTPPQLGLSAKERAANLRGAFIAERSFRGMRILLIDDVMTTGATAGACSAALLKAGAASVVVHTLARAAAI